MHKSMAMSRRALCLAVASIAFGATSAAVAAGGTVYACVNNDSGTTKLVNAGDTCSANATLVSWNVVGPVGRQGVAGPAGPSGPVGPQGPIGLTGLTGAAG